MTQTVLDRIKAYKLEEIAERFAEKAADRSHSICICLDPRGVCPNIAP